MTPITYSDLAEQEQQASEMRAAHLAQHNRKRAIRFWRFLLFALGVACVIALAVFGVVLIAGMVQ